MARIRTIKPEFFTSEDIVSLSPLARLLYIALWCEADRAGRMQWKPRTFKMRYLPADNVDVEALCDELVQSGLVTLYGGCLAYIPRFETHQHINPREAASLLPDPDAWMTRDERVEDATVTVHSPSVTRREEGKGREGKELTTSSLRSEVVGDSDDAQRTTSGTPKRAHSLNTDFEPDDTAIALAAELQISLAVELPKFRDYHAARGKPMKDWQAALRTWLRNAREFAGPASAAPRCGPPRSVSRDEGRAIAASTRLADFRAAVAADRGEIDERTIEAPTAPRLLG